MLDAHNGLQTGGLYYLGSVQNLSSITQTAQAALGNPGGNYRNSLPVWATAGATLLGTAPKQDFTITYLGGDGKNSPQYDISISDITGGSALYTAGTTGNLSFELASATCGNGVVYGSVPEPGTLALLAAGLMSLLAFAWRKRR